MRGFKDVGRMLGLAILLGGGWLVHTASVPFSLPPFSARDYALHALALQYLADYVHDPLLRAFIAPPYCGTVVLREFDNIRAEDRTEAVLRGRAQAMAKQYAGWKCWSVDTLGRRLASTDPRAKMSRHRCSPRVNRVLATEKPHRRAN